VYSYRVPLRSSELPTVPPPFDAERYAKDSDARLVAVSAAGSWAPEAPSATPRSETRLVARIETGAFTDEGWARTITGRLVLTMPLTQLKELPLDHRTGYLLTWMDGSIDLDTLIEVSTMSREEVLHIVRDLYDSGVVEIR
jgi:hypothetical protein